jgi:hypothetical protein
MHVQRTPSPGGRLSGPVCLATAVLVCTVALAGCGHSSTPTAATVENCGTSHTAANVPVEILVERGKVSCAVALKVEAGYAAAIVAGKAPGNGGGGPVPVSGWTCEGFATPELLKTGDASKCVKGKTEILATLKTPT